VALDLAVEARYWDPAVIPEDWHMFVAGRETGAQLLSRPCSARFGRFLDERSRARAARSR